MAKRSRYINTAYTAAMTAALLVPVIILFLVSDGIEETVPQPPAFYEALKDAQTPEASEIVRDLIPIIEENTEIQ